MEFREHAWQQQLHHMRLLHGAGAEVTERSLPNYPAVAMREVLRQSQHPHNVEPLLLTLCRPANATMRQRFAGAQGELILIEKALSKAPLASDLQVAVHGQIVQAADGILYPTKETNTSFEVWLRVEMLDALATMTSEGLVRSLVPEMQRKLVDDLLDLAGDKEQHELLRLYSFAAAVEAAKHLHAVRAAVAGDPAFLRCALAFLQQVTQDHSPCSVFQDPNEHARALGACLEAVYLSAVGGQRGGEPAAAAKPAASPGDPGAAAADLGAQPPQLAQELSDASAAAVVAQALEQACKLMLQRQQRMAAPPDQAQPAPHAAGEPGTSDGTAAQQQQQQQEQDPDIPPEVQQALDAIPDSFEANWKQFLAACDKRATLAARCSTAAVLAASLLQLLMLEQAPGSGAPGVWEAISGDALQLLAGSPQPLLQSVAGVLAAAAGRDLGRLAAPAPEATAIALLPGHAELVQQVFAKCCTGCCKKEDAALHHKKCSQCGKAWYCSVACQKTDWKAGHKTACKQLAAAV